MKKFIATVGMALLPTFLDASPSPFVLEGAVYNRTIDGDTITVNVPDLPPVFGLDLPIRLRGIDTAELRYDRCLNESQKAAQARDFLREMLESAPSIEVVNPERDKFFRVVADLYVDGQNVSDVLLIAGLAVSYDGGKKTHNWCAP